ncbi:MAG: hypothetical protein HYX87_05480 [Chloroflexi bacterium]|nr:hypothetical protein [Chloroflexota bacterium]
MKGTRKSYLLRINADLWEELNEWAASEFRSVNGQIEMLLQRAVDEHRHRHRYGAAGNSAAQQSGAPDVPAETTNAGQED